MIESEPTRSSKAKPRLALPPCDLGADRQMLLAVINLLLAGYHRIHPDGPVRSAKTEIPVEQWSDDEYIYLETRVPEEATGLELDLNVFDGVIYARFRRSDDVDAGREILAGREGATRGRGE